MPKRYIIYAMVVGLAIGAYLERKYNPAQDKTITKNNVVTIIKEILHPNGTKETETTVLDKSVKAQVITVKKLDWLVGVGVDTKQVYTFQVNRRVLGPIFLGVYASTNQSIGLGVLVEF